MAVVLGLHPGWVHDTSACIVIDGKLICAAEEERFVRIKHAPGFPPRNAVKFCLDSAHLTPYDIDAIAIPWILGQMWRMILSSYWLRFGADPRGFPGLPFEIAMGIRWATGQRKILAQAGLPSDIKAQMFFVEHHKAHAASAYFASGFESSTVLTVDGAGETNSTVIWDAADKMTKLDQEPVRNSLGTFYGLMTSHMGFGPNEEGKTMALAALGRPDSGVAEKMQSVVDLNVNRGYRLNSQYARESTTKQRREFGNASSRYLIGLFGPPAKNGESVQWPPYPDIAFAAQDALERALSNVVRRAIRLTGKRNICLAGGVALNCKANGVILDSGMVDDVFVFPAASDGGATVGAALEVARILGDKVGWRMEQANYGPEYSEEEIEEVLRTLRLPFEKCDDIAGTVGELVAQGRIVGWFQGKAELGPRALGARSIVADPRSTDTRDRANAIKGRERWRPLCPSILNEAKGEYFVNAREAPFMTISFQVREQKKKEVAGVVHVDASTRPQTVKKEISSLYWRMIKSFEEKTGIPMVTNTSFNLTGEPLVNSPLDAIRDFYTSGLEALAMGPFLLKKTP